MELTLDHRGSASCVVLVSLSCGPRTQISEKRVFVSFGELSQAVPANIFKMEN